MLTVTVKWEKLTKRTVRYAAETLDDENICRTLYVQQRALQQAFGEFPETLTVLIGTPDEMRDAESALEEFKLADK